MPLLRERATGAVDPATAKRLAKVLAGIQSPADGASVAVDGAPVPADGASVAVDGHTIAVPPEVRDAVLDLLQRFADGESVMVGSTDALLTTSQAAELLGISATYLLRLANEGTMPVEYRGTHRRFRLADAMEYLEKSRAAKTAKAAAAAGAARSAEVSSEATAVTPASG